MVPERIAFLGNTFAIKLISIASLSFVINSRFPVKIVSFAWFQWSHKQKG